MNKMRTIIRNLTRKLTTAPKRASLVTLLLAGGAMAPRVGLAGPTVSFLPHQTVGVPGSWSVTVVKLADMNGDGKLDAVVQDNGGHLWVFLGQGDGTFQTPGTNYQFSLISGAQNAPSYQDAGGVAIADFNHDGKLDVAACDFAGGHLAVFLGNGDGTLQSPIVYLSGTGSGSKPAAVIAGDFNGDGQTSLAVINEGEATLRIFYGNGTGSFPTSSSWSINWGSWGLCSGDFNNDGYLDLCVSSDVVQVLTNNQSGGFGEVTETTPGSSQAVAAGYFSPGNLSIVNTGWWEISPGFLGGGFLEIAQNPLQGTVEQVADIVGSPGNPQGLALADVNMDGKLDIVMANQHNNVYVILGNGDGTFVTPQTILPLAGRSWGLDVGDLNGHGRPDIVVGSYSDYFEVLLQGVPPSFVNSNNVAFGRGFTNSFRFTASGTPVPILRESGALPAGVTWNVNGTYATLSGIPTVTGTFPLTITASNGIGTNAVQNFTLTVFETSPTLATPYFANVKSTSAQLGGVVSDQGVSAITKRGFLLAPTAVNSQPALGGAGVVEVDDPVASVGGFYQTVTGLDPLTTYSFVAFASNSMVVGYSAVATFQTLSPPGLGSLVVTTANDEDNGTSDPNVGTGTSLREAVNYANLVGGNVTVTFSTNLFAGGPATIRLADNIIMDNTSAKTTVAGPGAKLLTITGSGSGAGTWSLFRMDNGSGEFDAMTFVNWNTSEKGAVIRSYGTITFNGCLFSNNATSSHGGAIYNGGSGTVVNCTFVNNCAEFNGGAIANEGTLSVANSTFSGNVATNNGGALANMYGASRTTVSCSTLTGNSSSNAGGDLDVGNGLLTVNDSIVSGNTAPTGPNVNGSLFNSGSDLIDANSNDIFVTGQPADNGGPTPTIALNPNGPAINAGDNTLIPAGITTDQRGMPRINDGAVDLGAYEFQFIPPGIVSASSATFLAGLNNQFNFGATGLPAAGFQVHGTWPASVTVGASGLSGTPVSADIGRYALTVMATNGISPSATQNFTLNIVGPDTFAAHPNFNTNGLGWAMNGDAVNGGPGIANSSFTLTDGNGGENRSGWFRYPLYVGGFQASFTYQDIGGNGADGTAFVIQNSTAGTAALGGIGGGLGYSGIAPSVAVMLGIYDGAAGGPSGVLVATNGQGNGAGYSSNIYQSTAPVNLDAGNPVSVNLVYLNGWLTIKLADTVTGASFTNLVSIDVTSFVGTNTAFVGITASEGGIFSHQVVSNFSYTPLPTLAATQNQNGSLGLSWPASIYGFTLESTASLNPPTWTNVNAAVTQTNGLNQITLPSAMGTQFFRLVL